MSDVVNDYTALLSGNYWNGIEVTQAPVIVTFSFPTSAPAYDSSVDGFTDATVNSFSGFTAAEQQEALQALGEWSAASGLVFVEVAPGQGDINFQNVDLSTTSYSEAGGIGFYPFGDWNNLSYPYFTSDLTASGDVFMNSQYISSVDGSVNYGTLLHEIGHAIGLKHPTEVVTDYAANPVVVHDQVLSSDDPDLTIMATVEDPNTGADSHLQTLDMQAAAYLYGPAGTGGVYTVSASGADAVSSWVWDATTQTMTQTALQTNEAVRGTSVDDVINGLAGDQLFALDGNDTLNGAGGGDKLYGGPGSDMLIGAGDDTFYVNSITTTVVENADNPNNSVYSTVSFTLPANIHLLQVNGQGLTAQGNNQGDTIYGDGTYSTNLIGGAGNDYIVGYAGNDTLSGGSGGDDTMWGGGGDNLFVFTSLNEMQVGNYLTAIGDFTSGQDKIDLSAITTTGSDPGQPLTFIGTNPFSDQAGQVREFNDGTNSFLQGDLNGDGTADFEITLYGLPSVQTSDFVFSPACYCRGVRILTPDGEQRIESLAPGQAVITLSGDARIARPIKWIGRRRIDLAAHPHPDVVSPIRIQRDAIADGVPHTDLLVSPDHAIFLDGMLIAARQLLNGSTIRRETGWRVVEYFHVELDSHALLLAEGLAAESYLDTGNRGLFANADEPLVLHPDLTDARDSASRETGSCVPFAYDADTVHPIWQGLVARAVALGQAAVPVPTTTDPDLRVDAMGRTITPIYVEGDRALFVLPRGATEVRLVSRSQRPTEARPWLDDRRTLGVLVAGLVIRTGSEMWPLPLDGPCLVKGWWAPERHGRTLLRWTDGDAVLRLPQSDQPALLEVRMGGGMVYVADHRCGVALRNGRGGDVESKVGLLRRSR